MLVLGRRLNEKLVLPTIDTTVQVVAIQGGVVRLGIEAPREVVVLREEVYQAMARDGQGAEAGPDAEARLSQVKDVLRDRLTNVGLHLDRFQRQAERQLTAAARGILGQLSQEFAQALRQLEAATADGENVPGSSAQTAPEN